MQKISDKRWNLWCGFFLVMYVALLVKLVLFKAPWADISGYSPEQYKTDLLRKSYHKANFTPFASLYYYLSGEEPFESGFKNVVGNIALFIPYGFLLGLLLERKGFIKALYVIFITSGAFEVIQLLTAYGIFDIDDIILNILGGSLGLIVFDILSSSYKKKLRVSLLGPFTWRHEATLP